MPKKPLTRLTDARRQAVFRLFDAKFKADTRITVGSATCENAAGAEAVFRRLQERLGERPLAGVTLGRVGCTGRCDLEPVVTVTTRNAIPVKYVRMTSEKVDEIFEKHLAGGAIVQEHTMRHLVGMPLAERVVSVADCPHHLEDSEAVTKAFSERIAKEGLADRVCVTRCACLGLCDKGVNAFVYPDGVTYTGLDGERVDRIVRDHFRDGKAVADYTWRGKRIANRFLPLYGDLSFFGKQLRLTLRNCGVIDPESLDEYLAVQGYEALAQVLTEGDPAAVVQTVLDSGLRGRGGGGFPTGLKWRFAAQQPGPEKFMVCNADEGDPGAFMDRSTIEGDPHSVLEGLIIGGYAIGAAQGYVYIRAEYPLAIRRIQKAIDDAREGGFLGRDILGSGFDFDVELRLGAGAFVCGEETAMIHSIEGRRGMPRPRPPYPSVEGLWGRPTVINNVETLANLPVIIVDRAQWFGSIGTEKSKGTKVFALAGKVNNTGLIEVPMGTTLRDIVYDVGGGIPGGKRFKAIQTGGPAGGCLPETALDTPVDYDTLTAAGSIMGSGGMIVMDEDTCMVDVAKFFLDFTQNESCGKCTPCREGTKRMLEMLERIVSGRGREEDLERLERLADTIQNASLCGLGQCAPNPVLSTLKHFRDEYEAHIRDHRCPAGVCTALVCYEIDPEKCVGCTACARKCPVDCIAGAPKKVHEIDQARCIKCGNCLRACRFDAVLRK